MLDLSRVGNKLTIRPVQAAGNWRVLLRGMEQCGGVKGGLAAEDSQGVLIVPNQTDTTVVATLRPEESRIEQQSNRDN
jgi:hypothetical protein